MRIEDWPVYVTDEDHLRCCAPVDDSGCTDRDGFFDLPGRRVSLGDVIDAIADHARDVHRAPIVGR